MDRTRIFDANRAERQRNNRIFHDKNDHPYPPPPTSPIFVLTVVHKYPTLRRSPSCARFIGYNPKMREADGELSAAPHMVVD
mmetsp:Transcript_4336/g.11382  ORF Transcript_4336/g.11382 Transcript_4336/m.11382 type:complete len:82 (+) Transcript_4336:1225-1470(+)